MMSILMHQKKQFEYQKLIETLGKTNEFLKHFYKNGSSDYVMKVKYEIKNTVSYFTIGGGAH